MENSDLSVSQFVEYCFPDAPGWKLSSVGDVALQEFKAHKSGVAASKNGLRLHTLLYNERSPRKRRTNVIVWKFTIRKANQYSWVDPADKDSSRWFRLARIAVLLFVGRSSVSIESVEN